MDKMIHIGQMLSTYIEKKSAKRSTICQKLGVPDSAIYSYEKRRSLQVLNIYNLCHALEYNFLADLANSLPETYGKGMFYKATQDEIIAQQTEEIKRLRVENDLMKELFKAK